MQREIKYIGFYESPFGKSKRNQALSATNKMDYIASSLNASGMAVHLISPSWMIDHSGTCFLEKTKTDHLSSWKKITVVSSWRTNTKIGDYLKIFWSLIWLFFFLIKNVKKDEKILVYHSPWLSLPIILAKKIKRFQLILEVEEIYGNVWQIKKILQKCEQVIIKESDYFIAVSDILAEILGSRVRAVLYGNYFLPKAENIQKDNSKINVVFAGAIENTRGGAYKALECAALLPENYVVHILGSGDKNDVDSLIKHADLINSRLNRKACYYHGVLIGKEYDDFLFKCHIAINPQNEGAYMNTAFPSKVISYLCHDLKVVSTKILSIEKSKLSHFITFSKDDSSYNIVQAILSIDNSKIYDFKSSIEKLNEDFIFELKNMFSD
ncbi:hypothetical protein [Chryseobacterium luquanense]|uniref:Glycosyl transferase family 1 domain-containing protein n=1 Tax=Chryseobacterium luquanense TaxID=2983766 RepID=A0ABT3Y054_9FLAO|nr:hypothetical protein [Chryseobacterium luquanense]MCX8531517.1 hypothetical protein [Chryseobacterium luquanense]